MTDMSPAEAIFFAALEQGTAEQRAAYLAEACGGDAELRRRVERLLAAHPQVGSFLAAATQDQPPPPAPADVVGTVVAGRYKLLQRIGEGGMGAVFMAEQTAPVKRLVALKVVKAGLDSRTVLARFEAERQALALMSHPNIARVLDAGSTEQGQPFFVMELVKGTPLTQFCDDRQLSVAQRLEVFQQVCQAVQHAHPKGIIHRDLKPGNILVESHDGRPVPKVIDFGLAKAMHALPLTERSLFTQFGAVLGTPLYMAPEQAEASAIDVDTRADIYALGVILYELLTGTTPLEQRRLGEAAWDEIRRVIKEEEPPRPSTRLSTLEGLRAVAARRQSEPGKLGRFVRGDLDWVAMKALAKERDRRYQTASALAADVGRFLSHEPVAAGPPTVRYKVRKFVRRHRGAVAAAGLVLLALVLGVGGTTWGLVRAAQALDEAEQAAAAERRARDQEAAERKQAEAVANLLESVFRQLDPRAEAQGGPGLKEQLVAQLDRAAENLQKEYPGQPLVRARLRNTLGLTQYGLGEWAKAEKLFQAVVAERRPLLGADHPGTLSALNNLATAYQAAGRTADAIPLYERVRSRQTAKLGPDHPDTLLTLSHLATAYRDAGRTADAIKLFEQVRDRRTKKLGQHHPETLGTLNNLAGVLLVSKQFDRVAALYRERLAAPPHNTPADDRGRATTQASLGRCLLQMGKPAEAEPVLRDCLAYRVKHEPDAWGTFNTKSMLGGILLGQKKYAEAEPLLLEGYAGMRQRAATIPQPVRAARLAEPIERLVQLYEVTGQDEQAAAWRKKWSANKAPPASGK